MLKQDFVPVAVDQWFQRSQDDSEGEFYRKIASQGPRSDFNATTQGRYVATASGKLIGYNNNRGPERIKAIMKSALAEDRTSETAPPLTNGTPDPRYHYPKPANALTLRVNAKILSGYEATDDWTAVFHDVISRDNLWIQEAEWKRLQQTLTNGGPIPEKIARRIARFHLVDNTRGEPPYWSQDDVKSLTMNMNSKGVITGQAHLETGDGKRGYLASFYGIIESTDDKISRFDLVASGQFWGSGQYTHHPPKGKFPLAIAFRLADGSDPADAMFPHGAKGWLDGYLQSDPNH